MTYLGVEEKVLIDKGGIYTAIEICQQPELWLKIYGLIRSQEHALREFLSEAPAFERIILTGAGTSAFIGMSLRGVFQRTTGKIVEAVPTTELVSHPRDFFLKSIPTLLISFARSGNSPESVAATYLADRCCEICAHLIITCNADGALAKLKVKGRKYIITLPPEANDQSLAMTSSYSGMLLTGKLVAHIDNLTSTEKSVQVIARYGLKSINLFSDEIQAIATQNFKRAVFLGSGPQLGTATEAQLKLQELSDGQVICKNDSFLGFRHGPKAVVDETTLVVYFLSNDPYVSQYERDLVLAMRKGKRPLTEIIVAEKRVNELSVDYQFTFSDDVVQVDEDFLAISNIVVAQLLGFYKSIALGLKPDTPSDSGAISRVVEGVHIYHLTN